MATEQAEGADEGRAGRWADTRPHPLRRYFARMIDVGLLGWPAVALGGPVMAPPGSRYAGLVEAFGVLPAAIIGCALFVGLTGTSPGKWIFGVRVLGRQGRPIGVYRALAREVDILIWGFGAGLPGAAPLAQLASFKRLSSGQRMWWDALQDASVAYRRFGWTDKVLSGVAFVAVGLALAVLELWREGYWRNAG